MDTLVDDIIESLKRYQDFNRKDLGEKYHSTSMDIIGVTMSDEKKILKELRKITSSFSPKEKINLAKKLVNTKIFECQHIAYEYLGKDKNVLHAISEKDIDDLQKNLDNWASVDGFSIFISGKAWRNGKITTDKIKKYLQSDNFWIRRIAVVSIVPLNLKAQGGNGDIDKTIEICKLVIKDHQEMINKALSWALRELSKFDKKPVFEFIDKYTNELHPRVVREVKNKLFTGRKIN